MQNQNLVEILNNLLKGFSLLLGAESVGYPAKLSLICYNCTDNHVLGEFGRGGLVSPCSSEPVTIHLKPGNEAKMCAFLLRQKWLLENFIEA